MDKLDPLTTGLFDPPPLNKSWIRYCVLMDLCLSVQYTYQTKIIQPHPHPKIPRKSDSAMVHLFWNLKSKYKFLQIFHYCIVYMHCIFGYHQIIDFNSARDIVTKLFKFFLGVITQTFRGVITQTVGH